MEVKLHESALGNCWGFVPAVYPDERALGSHWVGGRVCSKADPDVVKTNIRPLPGTKEQLSIPAAGHFTCYSVYSCMYVIYHFYIIKIVGPTIVTNLKVEIKSKGNFVPRHRAPGILDVIIRFRWVASFMFSLHYPWGRRTRHQADLNTAAMQHTILYEILCIYDRSPDLFLCMILSWNIPEGYRTGTN